MLTLKTPLGVPLYLLENSPFTDYLIPGNVLFSLIGLGNVMGAVIMFRLKPKHQGYISLLLSLALVTWIVVQCIILNTIAFLHVLFFVIGVVKGALARSLYF